MKNRYFFLTGVFLSILIIACGQKKSDDHHEGHGKMHDSNTWKEMDDFHMVMAETFHPYKDSADLKPVKSRATELVAAADTWANAPKPEKVDNDEMTTRLNTLKSEAEVLADVVQTGNDTQIGEQLTKVHDLFHEIQEAWYGGGHHHHEGEHDH